MQDQVRQAEQDLISILNTIINLGHNDDLVDQKSLTKSKLDYALNMN